MPIVAKLDEFGKPAWIALMILGFCGLVAAGSRDPRLRHRERTDGMLERSASMSRWQHDACGPDASGAGTLVAAAAAVERQPRLRRVPHRDTLRRLEDEQREFHDFLDRLRMAKDKSEFDQFMAERRNRTGPSSGTSPQN